MKLIIENPTGEDLKPFINDCIIPAIAQVIYSILDKKQLLKFDNYLSNKFNNINVNTHKIINLGIKNLTIQKWENQYQVQINPNINIPGIPAKLYDICALINYGNMELSPYPIFDKAMNKLALFVPSLYQEYNFGG